MLASGIKGIRVQLGIESDPSSTIFMRRRLGCPVCLQRGASPPFHCTEFCTIKSFHLEMDLLRILCECK
jgi:hypothetical protein